MTNFQKTRDWMRSALLELRTALQTFRIRDYSACVLHCQQSLERAVKSILVFLGKEIKRTHAPSLQIKQSMLEYPGEIQRLGLNQAQIELLVEIITWSSIFEGQGTCPATAGRRPSGSSYPMRSTMRSWCLYWWITSSEALGALRGRLSE